MVDTKYAPSAHWDEVFRRLHRGGKDLDWGNQWTAAFLEIMHSAHVHKVLDLGCGTGNDVVRLANAGFQVLGLDYSAEAMQQASEKAGPSANFIRADMTSPLPFASSSFDVVMSNVALHMFSGAITQRIFREITRVLCPNGLFLFHLNALEDRPLRAKVKPVVQEIEPNYVLEQDGQTMHFFSDAYIRGLLADWSSVRLEFVEIPHHQTCEPFKRVWRGIARK